MYNVCLVISYKGSFFYGFQSQPHHRTVYDEVVLVLSSIYKQEISCSFSGRTDSGVHAAQQYMNFKVDQFIPVNGLLKAMCSLLPNDIECHSVCYTDLSFDSRFSAKSREYRYRFSSDDSVPIFLRDFVLSNFNFDISYVNYLGKYLLGTHDFKGFSCKGSTPDTTFRTLYHFSAEEKEILDLVNSASYRYYEVVIIGNSFLYKMVRNILGAIFAVCNGSLSEQQFKQIVTDGDRTHHFQTIPSLGLCLSQVNY